MPCEDASDRLRSEIAAEIGAQGPIPFARFMEMSLYHPVLGYYTRGIGGGGGRDYLTSSGTHSAFGLLLARQVDEVWRRAGRPDPYHFVEFGPGGGYFALGFLQAPWRSRRAIRSAASSMPTGSSWKTARRSISTWRRRAGCRGPPVFCSAAI